MIKPIRHKFLVIIISLKLRNDWLLFKWLKKKCFKVSVILINTRYHRHYSNSNKTLQTTLFALKYSPQRIIYFRLSHIISHKNPASLPFFSYLYKFTLVQLAETQKHKQLYFTLSIFCIYFSPLKYTIL